MKDDLDEMMARLADGDRTAFSVVYQRLKGPIERLCQHMLAQPADAADAFQEAMQKICERASSDYDRHRAALPWAMAIAGWECRTIRRKHQRRRETADETAGETRGEAPSTHQSEDALIQKHLTDAALQTLGTLSPADQEALIATFWEEAPPVSGATLRKRRERALARLRTAFMRLYGLD